MSSGDDLLERLLDWPYQGETMAHEAADRIRTLQASNMRLSGMFYDLNAEIARLKAQVRFFERKALD